MEKENHYNWDDLDCGRFDLNHSQKFFARKHTKHEKLDEINFEFLSIMDENDSEKKRLEIPTDNWSEVVLENIVINTEQSSQPDSKMNSTERTESSAPVTGAPPGPSNLLRQPLVTSNFCGSARAKQVGPTLLKYKELYDKKRQNTIQRMREEERKNRIFRSKPAPNFAPFQIKKPRDICKSTKPVTPLVLKNSAEMKERRKRLIEKYEKRYEPLKFVSRNPRVLYEEPFIPQKTEHHVELHPFNLNMAKRLEERKQYNKQIKETAEEKKRQEECDKKLREEALVREIRKNACFKARPNPFK